MSVCCPCGGCECLCVVPVLGVRVSVCCPCGGRHNNVLLSFSRNGSLQVATASTATAAAAAVDNEASVVIAIDICGAGRGNYCDQQFFFFVFVMTI